MDRAFFKTLTTGFGFSSVIVIPDFKSFFIVLKSKNYSKMKLQHKYSTIGFDPQDIFVFINVRILEFFKKFHMDIVVKWLGFTCFNSYRLYVST